MTTAIVIFFFIFIVGYGLLTFIEIVSGIFTYQTNKYIGPYILIRNLKKQYRPAIEQNMPYYEKLDNKHRLKFEKRVQRFIDVKKFIPRGEIKEITPEQKALISGTAIKLTFGYPTVYLCHFWRVLLYHDNYYSEITKKYHKGEVNAKGNIILSWNNFLHGHNDRTDGINLGLHEMAHALRLENAIRNDEHNFLDFNSLYAFTILSKREIERMKQGIPSMFRKYAATNEHEFFSVFVENFFERPELTQSTHPNMYEAMCRILLQDPQRGLRIPIS